MKNLDLSEPKTIEDLDKIATAFTKDDPDKNGKNDTYGINMDKNFIEDGFCSVTGYFNANNAYPKIWVRDSAGKLAYGSIQPEAKAALAKLQNLYKQDIINKEFAIKDAGKASEDLVSGKAGMMWGMNWNPYYPLQGCKDKNPDSEWKAYVLPSNAKSQLNLPVSQYYVVNKNCKNPEVLLKMLNMWNSKKYDETLPEEEYEKYVVTTDPSKVDFQPYKYALFITSRSTSVLDDYNELQKALKDKDPSKLNRSSGNIDNYENVQKYFNGDMKQWAAYAVFGEGGSNYVISEMIKNKTYVMNEFYGAPTATMAEKWTTLKKMEDEVYTKIIMGAVSIDEFDKFVDNWKKLGGEAVTQEVNEWHASKQ